MMKALRIAAVVLALSLLAAQFVRPSRVNPPEAAGGSLEHHVAVPAEVAAVLSRSCADCHSNRTEWPWYSQVAPASWFVADHVNHGRRHLNFSEWARYEPGESADMLRHICHEARTGSMPLDSYTLLHPRARLTPRDVQTLCDWTAASQGVGR
jgi:Haem-binding domain